METIKKEPYVNSLDNYKEILSLQLSELENVQQLKDWKDFDAEIKNSDYFGKQLSKTYAFLDKVVDSLTKGKTSSIEKAFSIYNYVRLNFESKSGNEIFPRKNIDNVWNTKTGTIADVNLLLIVLLRQAGFDANPVLISKVGHAHAVDNYPFLRLYNYVASMVKIDQKSYYLDPAEKYCRFGTLPVYCYNGYARVIEDESYGVNLSANDLNDKIAYNVNVSRITDTTMTWDVTERLGVLSGAALREKLDNDSTYLEHQIKNRLSSLKSETIFIKSKIENRFNSEKDLEIKYTFKQKIDSQSSIMYINTNFIKFFEKNHFTASIRTLPIEFPSKLEQSYLLNILLPKGWKVTGIPSSTETSAAQGLLHCTSKYNFDTSSRLLTVESKFSRSETKFPVADYKELQQFYETVVQNQNGVLVINKNNER